MSTLADSMLLWKANLTTRATPEQVLTLRSDVNAFADGVRFLESENAKLRELASVAIAHMTPDGHQSSCNRECPAYKMCAGKSECKIIDWIDERASELWIEVE